MERLADAPALFNSLPRKEFPLTDWKTTVTGIIGGIAVLLSHFGVIIPESWQTILIVIAVAVLGLVSKDSKPANP